MKKSLNLLLIVLSTTVVTACGNNDGRKNRPNSFTFSYYRSGYGSDWVKAVTDYYMDNIDTSVNIILKESKNSESARIEIQAGSSGMKDIYQLEVDMSSHQQYLLDLKDVYDFDMSAYGEEGKFKDRIEDRWLEQYKEDNTFYRVPMTVTNGWNWVYNKTTLDTVLGAGNWELPRTTDEFFALGDTLLDHNAYLTAFAGGGDVSGEYTRYGNEIWFAQMLGKQGYDDYFGGFVRDAQGNRVFCKDSPQQILEASEAIISTYDIAQRLFTKSNHYVHPNSDLYSFTNIDQAIYNGKVYDGKKLKAPIAFAYLGGWLETEIKDSVEYGFIDPTTQEIFAMKMPINSAIISRTPSINDDETLAKVVSYVDGEGTLPEGVSQEDAEIIREARSFVAELLCREIVIPKNSSKTELTTKFLSWLGTVEAQKIASKATKGVGILPFGYVPTDEDLGITISPFIKSLLKIKETSYVLDEAPYSNPYRVFFPINWCNNSSIIASSAFGGHVLPSSEFNPVTNSAKTGVYDTVLVSYQGASGMTAFLAKYPNYGK